jgi:hypothetical protein
MLRILAIDPGKANGYAIVTYDEFLSLEKIGTVAESELYQLVQDYGETLDELVVEDFLNRPGKTRTGAFDWSNNHTSQVIGALRLLAIQTKTELVLQQPVQKVPGYGYLGKKYQKGRGGMHQFDALAHAAFRLVTKHKVPLPLKWQIELS